MRSSLADTIEKLAPHVPAALVSPRGLEAAARAVQGVPAKATRWLLLEIDGASPGGGADLAFAVSPKDDQGRRILAGQGAEALGPRLKKRPDWQRLQQLCARWCERSSPLWQTVHALWVELDTASGEDPRAPSVFLGARLEKTSAEEVLSFEPLGEAMEDLVGEAAWRRAAPTLEQALVPLPAGRYTIQLGAMLSRPTDRVRLCVAGLPASELRRYLGAVGAPTTAPALDLALRLLGGCVPSFVVQLEVGAEVGPRLGLELAARDEGLSWTAVLGDLVRAGTLCPEKKAACLGFEERAGAPQPGQPYRCLSHLKLTSDASTATPRLKLYFGQRW